MRDNAVENTSGADFSSLHGKIALVTGAAAGIGRAILDIFVAAGATVIAVDRDEARLRAVCDLPALRNRTHALVADMGREEDIVRLAEAAGAISPAIHVLCNNAGITTSALMQDLDSTMWDECVNIDLKGPYLLTRQVLPLLEAAQSASVINISSIHARLTEGGMAAYAAAKAGLIGLTRAMANELGPNGIRVNAICPGYIDTGYLAPVPAAVVAELRNRHPLRRTGEPHDVAGPALFLAGDLSRFVSGAVIAVDGGLGVRLPAALEE